MTCHSQIWTNAAILAPVRESLANNTPITWHRVTDLPDYVYFNHKIHIAKGVGCESCHGTMQDMALTQKARTLTMGFCLDCHRDPAPNLRPPEAIFNTDWHRSAGHAVPRRVAAAIPCRWPQPDGLLDMPSVTRERGAGNGAGLDRLARDPAFVARASAEFPQLASALGGPARSARRAEADGGRPRAGRSDRL